MNLINELDALKAKIEQIEGQLKKSNSKDLKSKSNPVFYRYIRPFNNELFVTDVDSQRGVTLRIELDYKTRKVKFSYAICNNKNGEPSFDKSVGRNIADSRRRYQINLWEKAGPLVGSDITEFIIDAINYNEVTIPKNDRKMIMEMYLDS